jgi:hypothetical protein
MLRNSLAKASPREPNLLGYDHYSRMHKAVPEMGAICYNDYLQTMPLQGEMNPCLDATWDTLGKLMTEFSSVFSDIRTWTHHCLKTTT